MIGSVVERAGTGSAAVKLRLLRGGNDNTADGGFDYNDEQSIKKRSKLYGDFKVKSSRSNEGVKWQKFPIGRGFTRTEASKAGSIGAMLPPDQLSYLDHFESELTSIPLQELAPTGRNRVREALRREHRDQRVPGGRHAPLTREYGAGLRARFEKLGIPPQKYDAYIEESGNTTFATKIAEQFLQDLESVKGFGQSGEGDFPTLFGSDYQELMKLDAAGGMQVKDPTVVMEKLTKIMRERVAYVAEARGGAATPEGGSFFGRRWGHTSPPSSLGELIKQDVDVAARRGILFNAPAVFAGAKAKMRDKELSWGAARAYQGKTGEDLIAKAKSILTPELWEATEKYGWNGVFGKRMSLGKRLRSDELLNLDQVYGNNEQAKLMKRILGGDAQGGPPFAKDFPHGYGAKNPAKAKNFKEFMDALRAQKGTAAASGLTDEEQQKYASKKLGAIEMKKGQGGSGGGRGNPRGGCACGTLV